MNALFTPDEKEKADEILSIDVMEEAERRHAKVLGESVDSLHRVAEALDAAVAKWPMPLWIIERLAQYHEKHPKA